MSNNKFSKIEDIKSSLYNPEDKSTSHHFEGELHKINYKTDDGWEKDIKEIKEEDKVRKPKTSILKIFFIGAIIFFLIALGYAFYRLSKGWVSV
jgi:hypothetical protein